MKKTSPPTRCLYRHRPDSTTTGDWGSDRRNKTTVAASALKTLGLGATALAAAASCTPLGATYTGNAQSIRSRSRSASRSTAPASVPPMAVGTIAPRGAAVKLINDGGGINGRMVEIVAEDDGTDPEARCRSGREDLPPSMDCDVGFGTLFSHVVIGSSHRAQES